MQYVDQLVDGMRRSDCEAEQILVAPLRLAPLALQNRWLELLWCVLDRQQRLQRNLLICDEAATAHNFQHLVVGLQERSPPRIYRLEWLRILLS